MMMQRRKFLLSAAVAIAAPAICTSAWAQNYPARPVRIIVGFPAGGLTDITARLIAQRLSEQLGQQFIVENRPGAVTNLATEAVVRAPADGYTLLLSNSMNAINTTLYDRLNYDFIRDVAPVASIVDAAFILEVHPLFQPGHFLNSLPMPRPTRTSLAMRRLVRGESNTSSPSCS